MEPGAVLRFLIRLAITAACGLGLLLLYFLEVVGGVATYGQLDTKVHPLWANAQPLLVLIALAVWFVPIPTRLKGRRSKRHSDSRSPKW